MEEPTKGGEGPALRWFYIYLDFLYKGGSRQRTYDLKTVSNPK